MKTSNKQVCISVKYVLIKACQFVNTIATYFIHRKTLNARFVCIDGNCSKEFIKYSNFKMHLFRNHLKRNDTTKLLESVSYNCKCSNSNCNFQRSTIEEIWPHVLQHLADDCMVRCPLNKCKNLQKVYRTTSALKSHFYRNHYSTKIQMQ